MTPAADTRGRLRAATAQIHERLHGHPGLGAAASGAMSRADYRLLLGRLWGFHTAFEEVLEAAARRLALDIDMAARARAPMLEADLRVLGLGADDIARLPRCAQIFQPRDEAGFMGALYVVEGSTLGGIQIARALAGLFDGAEGEGRRFFLGYGANHSAMWRGFLARLEACAKDEAGETAAIEGAVQTFADFERWMDDWRHEALEPGRAEKAPQPGTRASEQPVA